MDYGSGHFDVWPANLAWIVQSTVLDGRSGCQRWLLARRGRSAGERAMLRLTDEGWVDMGLLPGSDCRTVAAHDSKLFTITQQDQDSWDFRVLMLDQGQWLDITNLPADFFPQSLWDVDGELFLSSTGRMGGWNEQFADSTHVLHWNGAGWDGVGTDIGNVAVMFPFNGHVVGAGLVGGLGRARRRRGLTAAWNGTVWRALGAAVSYAVQGLAEFHGELVACGAFRTTNPARNSGCLQRPGWELATTDFSDRAGRNDPLWQ